MSKNDIQPAGAGPIWPLAPQMGGPLALPDQWAQRSYGGEGGLDINLATIWRIVSEWRWLILALTAVGIAGAIVVTLLTTPIYRATTTLEVSPPESEIMEDGKASRTQMQVDRAYLATQYGLLASRSLAQRVAQDLNLASNPAFAPPGADRADRLRSATGVLVTNFKVDPVKESRLIKISFSSPDPSVAATVANSYADNFINANLERRYEASSYARSFLERQIANVKSELEKSERQLVGYAQQQGIISTTGSSSGSGTPSDAGSLQGATLVSLNNALSEATTRRIAAEQAYRQSLAAGSSAEVVASTSGLRQQRAGLQAEYDEKLNTFRPEYPDMQRLRARIKALDEQIGIERGTVASGRANTLAAEYRAAANAERTIAGRVDQLKGAVLNLRGRSIQYNILQREVDTNRSLYDALLQRYKEIGVAGGIGKNLVSVVDRAEVPGSPYKPNLLINLLIGLGAGLIAGLGAALALEILNDTIKSPDDVRNKLDLASLGVIPKKQTQESLAEELKDQTSAVSEAYFSLRTSLQYTTDTGAPKTLLITSSRAAEGKSSTTLALAQNFARLGNRVLLIDADLRKPAFVTGSEKEEGLSKLLTAGDPIDAHVLKTQHENLSLLPCGPLPPNPAELLASPRLKTLIAEAAAQYDMVIVDGPPVLGLADAPLLGGACRGTLVVIESGKTRTRAAVDAINRLKASGSHIVGAVLTKYRHRSHGYGYGYSYEPYKYGGVGGREREIRLIAHREEA
jgi:capsular exopolysaccharide synthesis family protein